MTRVLSALVLLPVVVATIWWLPPAATLVLALIVAALASIEYSAIARGMHVAAWPVAGLLATLALCASVATPIVRADWVIAGTALVLGTMAVATGRPDRELLAGVGATLFGAAYIGWPLGALAAVHARWGPKVVFVALFAVIISDTAQYYCGRLLGRHPLAPSISPKKTVEGAVGGIVATGIALPLLAMWGLPGRPTGMLAGLGAVLAIVGIVGDLFESQLKRAAGKKDASHLIPGHGGMLDRVDALLFAIPVFYVALHMLSPNP